MSNSPYILSVDDEQVNLMIVEKALDKKIQIKSVGDGEQCLADIEQRKPDLIVLDIRLPGMSGIEVCKKIKSDDNYKDIPVILFSAFSRPEEIEKGMDAGANEYLTKPIDVVEFRKTVYKYLKDKMAVL